MMTIETATFGGGCFWRLEAVFEVVMIAPKLAELRVTRGAAL